MPNYMVGVMTSFFYVSVFFSRSLGIIRGGEARGVVSTASIAMRQFDMGPKVS